MNYPFSSARIIEQLGGPTLGDPGIGGKVELPPEFGDGTGHGGFSQTYPNAKAGEPPTLPDTTLGRIMDKAIKAGNSGTADLFGIKALIEPVSNALSIGSVYLLLFALFLIGVVMLFKGAAGEGVREGVREAIGA
jgi:hypothetical protein